MRINKNTSFPQPVLGFNDDYISNNTFEIEIERKLNNGIYQHQFKVNIENKDILSLLKNKEAYILVEVDCVDTVFRQSYKSYEVNFVIDISARNLRENYTIQTFICSEPRANYFTVDFNNDYINNSFSLEKNDIIGYAELDEFTFYANKDWDKSKNISNFIKIRNSGKTENHLPEIDDSEDILYIVVSEEDYLRYKNLLVENETAPFFISEYVLPTLVEILNRTDEENEYEGKKWYEALERMVYANEYLSSLYDQELSFELAQNLLKNPTSRSLKELQNKILSLKGTEESTFN